MCQADQVGAEFTKHGFQEVHWAEKETSPITSATE